VSSNSSKPVKLRNGETIKPFERRAGVAADNDFDFSILRA